MSSCDCPTKGMASSYGLSKDLRIVGGEWKREMNLGLFLHTACLCNRIVDDGHAHWAHMYANVSLQRSKNCEKD